jgi:hypothetical protein
MDTVRKIIRQDTINHTMPRNPPLAREGSRGYPHPEMALARRMRSGMAFMQVRLVDDLEPLRPQFCHQLGSYPLPHRT